MRYPYPNQSASQTPVVTSSVMCCRDTLRPKVRLWDLPGAGTSAVPAETYLQEGVGRLSWGFDEMFPVVTYFLQLMATCEGFWKLSRWSQDMGLRYFDRVVVVSAGRFTEMEALGKTFFNFETNSVMEFDSQSLCPLFFTFHWNDLGIEILWLWLWEFTGLARGLWYVFCLTVIGVFSFWWARCAGRTASRTGSAQRSILHGQNQGSSKFAHSLCSWRFFLKWLWWLGRLTKILPITKRSSVLWRCVMLHRWFEKHSWFTCPGELQDNFVEKQETLKQIREDLEKKHNVDTNSPWHSQCWSLFLSWFEILILTVSQWFS